MSTATENTIVKLAEISADTYQIGPELITLKVPVSESNGHYLVIEVTTPPGGGPPLHTHPSDEVFFVVSGEFEFPTIRDGRPHFVRASQGETVNISGNAPHTYKNVGSDYGTLIGVLAPGDEMEGFFKEGGLLYTDLPDRPGLDAQPDFPRMIAAAQKYDLDFLHPDD